MKTIARCGIYENRPELCRVYPNADHYIPPECTFTFPYGNGTREGSCSCDVGACCNLPREGGEPTGLPLSEEMGGAPCKYLVWEDVEDEPMEKVASWVSSHPLLRVIE